MAADNTRPSNVNERTYQEVEYLKKNLGPVLVAALAEICIRRPADPIEYLGHWLLRWRYNEELKRRDVQNALEVVRQKQWDTVEAGNRPDNLAQGVTPGYPNLPPGYGGPTQSDQVGHNLPEGLEFEDEGFGEMEGEAGVLSQPTEQRNSLGSASVGATVIDPNTGQRKSYGQASVAGGKRVSDGSASVPGVSGPSVSGGKRLSDGAASIAGGPIPSVGGGPAPSVTGGKRASDGGAPIAGGTAPIVGGGKRASDGTASLAGVPGGPAPIVGGGKRASDGTASLAGGSALNVAGGKRASDGGSVAGGTAPNAGGKRASDGAASGMGGPATSVAGGKQISEGAASTPGVPTSTVAGEKRTSDGAATTNAGRRKSEGGIPVANKPSGVIKK